MEKKLKETFRGIAILASPVITNQDRFGELGLTCHRDLSAAFAVTPHLGCYDHHLVWGGGMRNHEKNQESLVVEKKSGFVVGNMYLVQQGFSTFPGP